MSDAIEALSYLRALGEAGEGPHDIARAAVLLASLDRPGHPLEASLAHLEDLAQHLRGKGLDGLPTAAATRRLAEAMSQHFGYEGDRLSYDDPKNADLIAVIARRRGLPVALGILYIHAARAGGLLASGLNTPGHFLLSVASAAEEGGEFWLDPFNGGAAIARDEVSGPGSDARAVSDTEVLLRLQNNLKLRALQLGHGARALEVAGRMALIAPGHAEVWFDLARLNEEAGILGAARKAYEACLGLASAGAPLHNESALALDSLKRRLN